MFVTAPVDTEDESLRTAPLTSARELDSPPAGIDLLVIPEVSTGTYVVGFAVSERAILRSLRLRYQVFNEELGEGLMSSRATGIDRDIYDDQMHHLVLLERSSETVVGTYRLQTARRGLSKAGIYSDNQYDLRPIEPLFNELVEAGRVCIAQGHRTAEGVFALWKGVRRYMRLLEQRYLFGCCSLTTLDPKDGWRAKKTLRAMKCLHPQFMLEARPSFSCGDPLEEFDPEIGPALKLPKLFGAYMRLGCSVASQPGIDREFGTVDFVVLLDAKKVSLSSLLLG